MIHDYAKIEVESNFMSLTKTVRFICGPDKQVITLTDEFLNNCSPEYMFDLLMKKMHYFMVKHNEMPKILYGLIFGQPASPFDDSKLDFNNYTSVHHSPISFKEYMSENPLEIYSGSIAWDYSDAGKYKKHVPGGSRAPEVDKLPGIKSLVKHPLDGTTDSIQSIIINLNDTYKWTREEIADWLETLDIDLRFK